MPLNSVITNYFDANAASDTSGTANSNSDTANSSTDASPPSDAHQPAHDQSQGGHTANGKSETLRTGSDFDKAKAAALAAVSGGTVERVETGVGRYDTYEAIWLSRMAAM